MATACPHCRCVSADDGGAHGLLVLLDVDDLDAALAHGLLDARPCPTCDADCNARLIAARDARHFALAARERHAARAKRLLRRKVEREAGRAPLPTPTARAPALPPSAADVLTRALAKAAGRSPR